MIRPITRRMTEPLVSQQRDESNAPLAMWGGVECTLNRVGDEWFSQLARNGHLARIDDLDRFAALGIRALRYPVLWEHVAPDGLERIDWTWVDARLGRLRELGLRPIVGLVHHGSGPRHASITDARFATELARFARLVAERHPWIDAWTPVNEPLTTARFCGLYGLWHPHGRHASAFARALVNQCRAIALVMRAVREVNPGAQLVQTEDLGRVYATPALAYQADFENERRWLSFDLLCGRVDRAHAMHRELRAWGIADAELDDFVEHPCMPNVLGINHYLTSDRFLDEHIEQYPAWTYGGNAWQLYADVEAVRACPDCEIGIAGRLRETWERYRLPLAITELHLGGTRDEQLRWLLEGWRAAQALRDAGADVRAVTAWSLLGAFDWNQLVTKQNGFYEPGAFDVRSPTPRPTALARLVRTLARGETPNEALLEQPGWWRRADRLLYPAAHGRSYALPTGPGVDMRDRSARPLVITGAGGTLGRAFARLCDVRGLPYHAMTRRELDIADARAVSDALDATHPWAVVNCAGYVRVDDAERDAERCMRENATGPAVLAAACARRGIGLLAFSSDLVFDGAREVPYVESDQPSPLGVYGWSKAKMERCVLDIHPGAMVVRTSAFFGPWDEWNFVTRTVAALARGERVPAACDVTVSPTYVVDLVHAALDLLIDGERGVWHLANVGAVTWAELARLAAGVAGVSERGIEPRPVAEMELSAERPRWSALASERAQLLPSLHDALTRCLADRQRATALPGRQAPAPR